jgi:hypothetical protein
MQSIPTGDPVSLHPKDANYSRWKAITLNTYPWENSHTGHLKGINYLI